MKRINLLLGVHNHQPVGNFEFVFKEAFQKAYDPFIRTLYKYPGVKLNLHFSGALLQWIAEYSSTYIELIKEMVSIGQIEVFGGGFYEPILPIISESDQYEQISKLSSSIEEMFGKKPKGLWLAERVWEPHLPSVLAKCGIEYVTVDDTHFKNAGFYEDELNGYFVTEDQGRMLKVFPINKPLRYLIPAEDPEKAIQFLQERTSENGDNMYLMFDDGEKFGVWPDTYQRVYQEKWLDRFFSLLEDNREWLSTMTCQEFVQTHKPKGRAYLPTASYSEMMNWALPSRARHHFERIENELKAQDSYDKYAMFLKSGFWRTFLSKYSEANLMHKKMLHIREKITEDMPESILEHVLKAQANDAYWHGVFGGLYLPNLRSSVYANLIKAEKEIDTYLHGNQDFIELTEKDIDMDGYNEILISTKKFTIGISPNNGGRIFEISVKERDINLCNNLTRRYESYHESMANAQTAEDGGKGQLLVKEKGLEKFLNYDWYEKYSLIDHFFGDWNDLTKYSKSRHPEQGDFVNQKYDYEITGRDTGEVKLTKKGHIWVGSQWLPIQVEKTVQIEDDGFSVHHRITNESELTIPLMYGCEYNINLLSPNSSDRYFYCPEFEKKTLGEAGKVKATFFGARSEYEKVDISFQPGKEVEFWFFPVYTVSFSEGGFEKVYQCSSITPMYHFQLEPLADYQTNLKIKIKAL
jgi:alpha-amylase